MSGNSQKPGKASHISIIVSSCLTAEDSSVTLLEPFPPLSRERKTNCPRRAGSSQTGPILILIILALLMEGCWASSSWHSLYYSYTFISKPSQGLPQFSILESVDGQPIAHYDSNTKEYRSLVPWMEKVKKEEPLWKEYTRIAKRAEQDFGRNLVTLQKYYNHSEEPPTVTVTSKAEASQTETHICRVDGFFPKDINATWRKDGEIWLKDTLHGLIAPNSDGTYHFWLGIRISPSERNHFQCRVEHSSLKNPLKVVLMVPAPHPLSIIITVLGAILMAVLIGCCLCLVVHIQVQTFQASPGERSFNVKYWILIVFGLLLLILGFIGFLHYFDLILGSVLLHYIFLGVFLSCYVLAIVGFSMWIKMQLPGGEKETLC